jgi:putative ABC transport system substrate-binding protein
MRRRDFLIAIAVFETVVQAALAQEPARMKRLAILHPAAKPDDLKIGADPHYTIILEEIQRLGYVEGVNLIIDRYSAEGRYDRFREISRQAVAAKPDVIFAVANPLVLALCAETRTIPIVAWTGDPVAIGIVKSLARPGGNVTGLSTDAGPELYGKEVEFLAQAVGKLSNARLLLSAANDQSPATKAIRQACERLMVPCQLERLTSPIFDNPLGAQPAKVQPTFESVRDCKIREEADGLLVNTDTKEPFSYKDACVVHGPHTGSDPAATQEASRAVKELFTMVFQLH